MAVVASGGVVGAELTWFRTGIFRLKAYWVSMVILVGFQIVVDGWLTKLSAPIVAYSAEEFSGWRFPLDIPVENFLFGFALVTTAIVLWESHGLRGRSRN
jgi:lycopene cyclase domain-containing protein